MTSTSVPLHCFYCGYEIQPGPESKYLLPDGPIHKVCYERRLAATDPDSIVLGSDDVQAFRDALEFGVDLIKGDAVGAEWKRGCATFISNVRAALSMLQSKEPQS